MSFEGPICAPCGSQVSWYCAASQLAPSPIAPRPSTAGLPLFRATASSANQVAKGLAAAFLYRLRKARFELQQLQLTWTERRLHCRADNVEATIHRAGDDAGRRLRGRGDRRHRHRRHHRQHRRDREEEEQANAFHPDIVLPCLRRPSPCTEQETACTQ